MKVFNAKNYLFIKKGYDSIWMIPKQRWEQDTLYLKTDNCVGGNPYSHFGVEKGHLLNGVHFISELIHDYEDWIKLLSKCVDKFKLRLDISITEFQKICEWLSVEPYYAKLKDIDLKTPQFFYLECKIKNIRPPKLIYREMSQRVTVYDDDTNKTVKTVFTDNLADFDKWEKGTRILLIGRYLPHTNLQLVVHDAIILEDSEEPSIINRNDANPEYGNWRDKILSCDDHECVCCGHNKHLQVHHLYGYKEHPELAIDESNGVTLCKFCHDKYHSIYGLKNINPRDFIQFIKDYAKRS